MQAVMGALQAWPSTAKVFGGISGLQCGLGSEVLDGQWQPGQGTASWWLYLRIVVQDGPWFNLGSKPLV